MIFWGKFCHLRPPRRTGVRGAAAETRRDGRRDVRPPRRRRGPQPRRQLCKQLRARPSAENRSGELVPRS
eukprot:1696404-Prymnesium_polylepis.1